MNEKAIVIYSGGLDSTPLLYHLRNAGYELKALSVNYGQRHLHRELRIPRSTNTDPHAQSQLDLGSSSARWSS